MTGNGLHRFVFHVLLTIVQLCIADMNDQSVRVETEREFNNLTITAILFNPTTSHSQWVDRIFGFKSVFYPTSHTSSDPLSEEEILMRHTSFQNIFQLPPQALYPPCSIELLGYAALEIADPFMSKSRHINASVGESFLMTEQLLSGFVIIWSCYYRPVYENWRFESSALDKHFWTVLFFCIPPRTAENDARRSCRDFGTLVDGAKTDYVDFNLSLHLQGQVHWVTSFSATAVMLQKEKYMKSMTVELQPFDSKKRSPSLVKPSFGSSRVAVCTVIPYVSSDTDKVAINGVMLSEWIRYYTKLGFQVIVYDRDGAHNNFVVNVTHGADREHSTRHHQSHMGEGSFVYHNYTLRGLVDPSTRGVGYDNTEVLGAAAFTSRRHRAATHNKNKYYTHTHAAATAAASVVAPLSIRGRHELQGHDKTATLTQCRFEAKTLYGIEKVLVADFDEFLFCPLASSSSVEGQSKYLLSYLRDLELYGIEQWLLFNKTESPVDCMLAQTEKNLSIHACFGSSKYYIPGNSYKSLHLKHVCPLTGYHQACPTTQSPRAFNCICSTMTTRVDFGRTDTHELSLKGCVVLHLSTNARQYKGWTRYTAEQVNLAMSTQSEIDVLLQSD